MGYINKDELSQELLDYLTSSSSGINLTKTDNLSYNTTNGLCEFECEQEGYIDNVYMEGKTLVNLATGMKAYALTESNGNLWNSNGSETDATCTYANGVYTFVSGTGANADFAKVIAVKPNTTYTFSVNVVETGGSYVQLKMGQFSAYPTFDLSNANAEIWLGITSTTKVNIAGKQKYTFTTSTDCKYALFTVQCENAETTFKFSDVMVLEGDYSNVEVPSFEGVNSIGQGDLIKIQNLNSNSEVQDERHIPVTLRSLPNGFKDTIEYINGRYVKVQHCNEIIIDGKNSIYALSGVENQVDTIAFNIQLNGITIEPLPTATDELTIVCDKFNAHAKANETEDIEGICQGNGTQKYIRLRIQRARLSEETVKGLREWLNENPITIVYQLTTPLYVEIPNFNIRTNNGFNRLQLNSGVIQGDCEFEVTTSLGSELDVLKNNSGDYNMVIAEMQKTINDLNDKINDICSSSYPYEYLKGEYFHKSNNGQTFLNTAAVDLDNVMDNMYTQTTSAMGLVNLPYSESGGAGIFECKVVYSANSKRHVIQKYRNTNYNIEYMRMYNYDNAVWTTWEVVAGNSYLSGASADFNNYISSGEYYISGTTGGAANAPTTDNNGWFLEVSARRDGVFIYQKAVQVINNDTYIPKYDRFYFNGTWNAWRYL